MTAEDANDVAANLRVIALRLDYGAEMDTEADARRACADSARRLRALAAIVPPTPLLCWCEGCPRPATVQTADRLVWCDDCVPDAFESEEVPRG